MLGPTGRWRKAPGKRWHRQYLTPPRIGFIRMGLPAAMVSGIHIEERWNVEVEEP